MVLTADKIAQKCFAFIALFVGHQLESPDFDQTTSVAFEIGISFQGAVKPR
ncbi:hypothetical protein GURASL_20930 [Geotalea uraniireducens]|uniref:Uncharacterized protein n=1 Tax=Geotalea uraniireducens TaxID=351604 RepID=A0ABN6VXJ1_9BACT|nr:hypothetical protein GURASL_20930 [Geotalea uraniireducens]